MAAWVQTGLYGAINKIDTAIMGYYVIKFMSVYYTLQEETMFDGKISNSGELVAKSQYMNCIQDNMKFYWG